MPVTQLSPPLPPYYRPCRGSVIPPYSPEPSAGEESLSRPSPIRSPRGEFVQSNGRITLTLKEQAENSAAPTYAPGGLVTGKISIQGSESVTEVVLKLTGRLDLAASNGGQPTELVKDSYTVWSDSMRFLCPPSIPFSFIFPSTFKDGDQTWPLPPSLRIAPPGKPFTYVKCTYTLSVVVSTALHPRFSLWRGEKTLKNIQCSLFIPSVLIYGLSDSIPFHLQSSGPAAILKGMIQPLFAESKTQHPVRVHITRRVSLLVRGERQHRNIDIGEGVLSILPPPCYSELLDPRDASVDWAGVIQCNDITATGTFDSGILYVKDFVVVSIPAWRLEHKFQIQLVSNTWHDTGPVVDQV
ncbi:hypothetical protein B0H14DRAFT_2936568 [Mycena olivaceomarginata]|nr:hypothetical protein B0H14DRAFT_2936568 [Mycena olivaceomarginata]